jgi:hypothetical protein
VLPDTWVIDSLTCDNNHIIQDCSILRGNTFNPGSSASWVPVNGTSSTYSLGAEAIHGWDQSDYGEFGVDVLSVNTPKGIVPVKNTIIGSMNTNDTAIGFLGLNPKNLTFGNATPSLISTMYESGIIPSLSYSYHAGLYSMCNPMFLLHI